MTGLGGWWSIVCAPLLASPLLQPSPSQGRGTAALPGGGKPLPYTQKEDESGKRPYRQSIF